MGKNTIAYLVSKVWYRFIKVVFLLIFILAVILGCCLSYDSYRTRQVDDYLVTCQYGNKTSFAAWDEKGIYLSDYDLTNGLSSIPDGTKAKIMKSCEISEAEIDNFVSVLQENDGFVPDLYRISKTKIEKGGTARIVEYSLIYIFIISLVFEVIRRAFYYIALGTIRPKK